MRSECRREESDHGCAQDGCDDGNRDPRMRDVYLGYLRDWRAQTGQPFHHFTDVELWTAYGRWGAKQYPGQSRAGMPKFDALLAFAEETA